MYDATQIHQRVYNDWIVGFLIIRAQYQDIFAHFHFGRFVVEKVDDQQKSFLKEEKQE